MAKKAKNKGRSETATGSEDENEGDEAEAAAPPGTVIPPKVAPKMRAEAALVPGHTVGPDPVAATAGKTLEALRGSWQLIAAAALVLVVVVLFVSWRLDASRARNRLAWQELRELGEKPDAAKLQDLAGRYAGTAAEPFILLELGDVSLARGDKDGASQALATYDRVLKDHGSNEIAAYLARGASEAAKKRLDFDPVKRAAEKGEKVEWAKGAEPAAASPTAAPK